MTDAALARKTYASTKREFLLLDKKLTSLPMLSEERALLRPHWRIALNSYVAMIQYRHANPEAFL